ncbi:hypothetical protein [Cupriavidus sp. WS]|uniref:hypothetical protein n=1 Tax=Cupriavidus sp. WS TaxID=1312922 RepID=UPI00037894B1|nr:hypothetical protein [Cupriavidus sp. WS]
MYLIHIGTDRADPCTTLAGVLEYLNRERTPRAPIQLDQIAVRHIERGEIPVVQLKEGRFGVRPSGTARSILSMMIDEVDQFIVRVNGGVRRPHEMSRASWGAVVAAGRLGYFPEEAIDMSRGEAGPLFQAADLFEEQGPFDIAAYVHGEFHNRFGYGVNGPAYSRNQGPNARHEVHIAYALLRGDKVRECVINAYRDDSSFGRFGLQWMRALIDVPALRGALPEEKLRQLCNVMHIEKLAITAANAGRLVGIMRRLPDDCTYIHVDDALFEAGILPPRMPSALRLPQGDSAKPATDLAARIHHETTQRRFEVWMSRARAEREAFKITQREFDYQARAAVVERASAGYEWSNRVALAVLQRNVATLLEILDGPKDLNAQSKRAIRDVIGVDLLQCTAAVRRRRIFAMCDFSEAEQERWEAETSAERAQRRAASDFDRVREQAEASQWRIEGGRTMNGREYVEFCIAEGFSEIVDMARGNAREYRFQNPGKRVSRRLRAKDGTLAYARARLEQLAQPEIFAA